MATKNLLNLGLAVVLTTPLTFGIAAAEQKSGNQDSTSSQSTQTTTQQKKPAYIAHRGVTAVGPRGGVYHRGGTAGN